MRGWRRGVCGSGPSARMRLKWASGAGPRAGMSWALLFAGLQGKRVGPSGERGASWAAGKGERDGRREGLGGPERGKGREECWAGSWVGLVLVGWVGFGWVFFLPLFFFLSTQNYLNSNEFEFKLLYNQTK